MRLPFLGGPILAGGSSSEFEVTIPDVTVVGPRRGGSFLDRIVNAASDVLDGGWSLVNGVTMAINSVATRVANALPSIDLRVSDNTRFTLNSRGVALRTPLGMSYIGREGFGTSLRGVGAAFVTGRSADASLFRARAALSGDGVALSAPDASYTISRSRGGVFTTVSDVSMSATFNDGGLQGSVRVRGSGSVGFDIGASLDRASVSGTIANIGSARVGIVAKEVVPDGIVYLRKDATGAIDPYGGKTTEANYLARQVAHNRAFPDSEFQYTIVDRASPGRALDIAEHNFIQELTGGVAARRSSAVSNLRDPVGARRRPIFGLPEPR